MKPKRHNRFHLLACAVLAAGAAANCNEPGADEGAVSGDNTPPAGEPDGDTSNFIIFPDDSGPGDSCRLNVPLNCANTQYSLRYYSNILTSTRSTTTFPRSGNASISSNGRNIACTASAGFSVGGVEYLGAADVAVEPYYHDSGKLIVYDPPIFSAQVRPEGAFVPGPQNKTCGTPCDPTAPLVPPCSVPAQFPTRALVGQISSAGSATRDVTMSGIVDKFTFVPDPNPGVYNPEPNVRVYCRWSVPANQLVASRTRPNDVISVTGNRFVRGYELTGQARETACRNIASAECTSGGGRLDGVNEACIIPRTRQCVADFSKPDPCASRCIACTSNASCGTNATCSGGCCIPTIR
jgi:hypothetical protein